MSSTNASDLKLSTSTERQGTTNSPPTSSLATEVKLEPQGHEASLHTDLAADSATKPSTSPSSKHSGDHKAQPLQDDTPPVKPPRPISPQSRALTTLIEAFPSIDTKVIKAVLAASGGQVEPAFNALLGMSDPSFQDNSTRSPAPPTVNQQQLHADELYARQLAEHYSASDQNRGVSGIRGEAQPYPSLRTQHNNLSARPGQQPSNDDRDYSFFDDELPVIQQNLKQGFLQTQTRVNKWISDFRKRIDGDEPVDASSSDPLYADQARPSQPARHNFGASQASQLRGIQRLSQQQQGNAAAGAMSAGASTRRNRSADRYDADPKELGDNLDELYLDDDAGVSAESTPPPKPPRPHTNPDLFRSSTTGVHAPQSGPVDEVDAMVRTPADRRKSGSLLGTAAAAAAASPVAGSGGKSKKWQPLTSVAPAPRANEGDDEDEADPFSLGDDDDEVDGEGEAAKGQDLLQESTARLKAAAAGKDEAKTRKMSLEPKEEGSGTRDKEAESILKS